MAYSTIPTLARAVLFLFCGIFRMQRGDYLVENHKSLGSISSKPTSLQMDPEIPKADHFHQDSVYPTTEETVKMGLATEYPEVSSTSTPISKHRGAKDMKRSIACGPGECAAGEICVSWMRESKSKKGTLRPESPIIMHECLPNDGVHWNKMSPSGVRLCPDGKTYSLSKQNQSCLLDSVPCELSWIYSCVNEEDSPHDCKLKKCESDHQCVETIHCDFQPPCIKYATCVPKHLFGHQ